MNEMKLLIQYLIVLTFLISCSGGGSGATSTGTTSSNLTLSDIFSSSNSTYWTVSNPNSATIQYAANSNNTRSVKISGGVSNSVTFTGKTHFTASSFTINGNFGFDDEQGLGNGYEVTLDYGNNDKVVATFYISAVNTYISPRNNSNDTQASFYYKVYKSNVLQTTSSTQSYGAILNDWDSEHTFMQNFSIARSNGNISLDINGNGGSVSMSVAQSTYSFGSDVSISIKAFSTSSASLALTIDNFSLSGSALGYR